MIERCAVIIQARMSSSRLPGKSLLKIGGHPLIHYVIKRCESIKLPVIVAISEDSSDDSLADFLKSYEIETYRGDLNNVLARYISAAEFYGIENIIRITGDNPLIDLKALQDALPLFEKYSYVDAIYENGFTKGTGFELVKLDELKKVHSLNTFHTEHVTTFLREKMPHPLYFKLSPPAYQKEFVDRMVLTCDYKEDFEVLKNVLAAFDYNPLVPLSSVFQLYNNNPQLFNKNIGLH